MHILVVEDVRLAREILTAVAYSAVKDAVVRAAESLAEGLAVGRSMLRVDMLLLDLGLPGCTGTQALLSFKDAFPTAKTIVVSANDASETAEAALQAGADAFVAKNRIPGDLFSAIRAVEEGRPFAPATAVATRLAP